MKLMAYSRILSAMLTAQGMLQEAAAKICAVFFCGFCWDGAWALGWRDINAGGALNSCLNLSTAWRSRPGRDSARGKKLLLPHHPSPLQPSPSFSGLLDGISLTFSHSQPPQAQLSPRLSPRPGHSP